GVRDRPCERQQEKRKRKKAKRPSPRLSSDSATLAVRRSGVNGESGWLEYPAASKTRLRAWALVTIRNVCLTDSRRGFILRRIEGRVSSTDWQRPWAEVTLA